MPSPPIHRIPTPTPFAVGELNTYLVLGDRPVLVDTGVRTDAAWEALAAGLRAHGVAIGDLASIVLTHGHVDHYGQAARIHAASGAERVAHEATASLVSSFLWDDERMVANTRSFFASHGVPAATVDRTIDELGSGRTLQEPVEIDRTIAHGDVLELGAGLTFRVFEVQGHLPGHVVLHHEESRTLLAGDQLLERAPTVPFLFLRDWHERRRPSSLNLYLMSLVHLSALEVDRVLPAHGTFSIPHRERIGQIQRRYERLRNRTRTLLGDGPTSAWELARRLYRGQAEARPFLVMSEVVGTLDHLDRSGEAEQLERNGGSMAYALTPRGVAVLKGDVPARFRIDRQGRWFDDGHEITHERTLALLRRSIERLDDGTHVVVSGGDRVPVEVEDAPCVVQRIDRRESGVRLDLGDGRWEPLLPETLRVGHDNVLYATVGGGLLARFARSAYYEMAQHVEEGASGRFDFVTPDGEHHPLGSA